MAEVAYWPSDLRGDSLWVVPQLKSKLNAGGIVFPYGGSYTAITATSLISITMNHHYDSSL